MQLSSSAAGLITAGVTLGLLFGSGSAGATPPAVSPGDGVAFGDAVCTIGLLGYARDRTPVAVTANHCVPAGKTTTATLGRTVGRVVAQQAGDDFDYALIALPATTQITPAAIAAPPAVGDTVCKQGTTTGRTCGPVTAVSSHQLTADVRAAGGDSGGPLFNTSGQIVALTNRAADGWYTDPLPLLRSIAGVGPAWPTVFIRADAIARDLSGRAAFPTPSTAD